MAAIHHGPMRPRPRVTFWVLAAAVSSFSLLQAVSIPTVPLVAREFGCSQATATWVLTSFLLTAAAATPIMGRAGDAFGKRRMLLWSLAALTVGSVLAAAAPSFPLLLAARAIQGLGGGTLPLSFSIIRDELPPRRVPGAVSFVSSLLALGFGVGIVVSGPVAESIGFHWLYLLPALTAVLAGAATVLLVPESPRRSGAPVPLFPALLLASWLLCLLVGVTRAPAWGWTSPPVVSLLAGSGLLLVAWVAVELRAAVPLVDLRLMSQRGVWTANAIALLAGIVTFGSLGFLPQFTQTPIENGYGFGASVTEAGHMMLPSLFSSFTCGLIGARVMATIGIRGALAAAGSITAVSLTLLTAMHEHAWQIYLINGLTGFGTGLTFACLTNAVLVAVPAEHTGTATGLNTNLRNIGGAIGTAAMASIVATRTLPNGSPAVEGYLTGFFMLACTAALAASIAILIPSNPRLASS